MNKKRYKRRCCDIWIPSKCLKCWNKCCHFAKHFFLSLSCRRNKSQALSGYPISLPSPVTTWHCVFSVKKDFSRLHCSQGEKNGEGRQAATCNLFKWYIAKNLLCYIMRGIVLCDEEMCTEFTHLVLSVCAAFLRHLIPGRTIWFDVNA